MGLISRKPVFQVSDKVRHKPGCTITEGGFRSLKFWIKKAGDCTYHVVKTKALISCAVTVQLICAFVFTYAKSRFSYDTAQLISTLLIPLKKSF